MEIVLLMLFLALMISIWNFNHSGPFCIGPDLVLEEEFGCSTPDCEEAFDACFAVEPPFLWFCLCEEEDGCVVRKCWSCEHEGWVCPGGGTSCRLVIGSEASLVELSCQCLAL